VDLCEGGGVSRQEGVGAAGGRTGEASVDRQRPHVITAGTATAPRLRTATCRPILFTTVLSIGFSFWSLFPAAGSRVQKRAGRAYLN
jgi:hypothetical protein